MRFILLFSISLLSSISIAQNSINLSDDEPKTNYSGWQFGGNMGMYFANKTTANYYNGSRTDNNNAYINDSTMLSRVVYNPFNYKQIKDIVGGYNYRIGEYANNMKYTPAMSFGIYARYQFDGILGIFGQFNYAKLSSSDFFTLELDKFNDGYSEPYIYTANISGTEERINIDLGASFLLKNERKIYPYIETAINLSEVTVKDAKIKIDDLEYSIMSPYNQMYSIKEGGLGLGGQVSFGYQIEFNPKFIFNIGPTLYISKINLGENPKYAMNGLLQMRILFI